MALTLSGSQQPLRLPPFGQVLAAQCLRTDDSLRNLVQHKGRSETA